MEKLVRNQEGLLTVITEVVHQDYLLDEVLGTSVEYTVWERHGLLR